MTYSPLFWLTVAGCGGILLGCFCRLKSINFFNARFDYVAQHVLWMIYAGWMIYANTDGQEGLYFELIPVAIGLLWLKLSRFSWVLSGGKPPPHILRRGHRPPYVLDEEDLRHVTGGVKR